MGVKYFCVVFEMFPYNKFVGVLIVLLFELFNLFVKLYGALKIWILLCDFFIVYT